MRLCTVLWVARNFCMNEMQSAADSLQEEVSPLLSIHIQGSKDL